MLKFDAREPGIIVSGAVHAGVLLAALVVFTETPKFDPAQETVPVEVLTDQQFNEITQGQKTAEEKKPLPPVASKIADIPEPQPRPTQQEAKVETPAPPPPLRRLPDPETDDTPPVPTPPQRVAALPPPRPVEPPKPQVQPPPRPVEPPKAEAIDPPKPPERPKPPEKPREVKDTPKPPDKPKNDQLAKLIDTKADAPRPAARPRSADAPDHSRRFDASSIAQALSHEPAQQRAATGRQVNQTASLGAPNANAPRMSPSLWGQLDGYLQEQYKQCWTFLGLSEGQKYVPQIKVTFAQNGGLIGAPELLNRSSDPNMRTLAESALRAVKKCDPLRIPPQYAPYYNEWRVRILRFDPAEMAG